MSGKDEPPAPELVESHVSDLTVTTNQMLYRFLTAGSFMFTLSFGHNNDRTKVDISWSACCCFCVERSVVADTIRVRRQPLCHWFRLLRDAAFAFILVFLFHLVPAVIWGPERSLGSSSNHATMGIVWFLGWPVWFIFTQMLLRPWGIELMEGDESFFAPFDSWKHASEIVTWYQNRKSNKQQLELPQKPRLIADPWFIAGWVFALFLIPNVFVTGFLAMKCSNRGCCKDDEKTL